MTREKRQSACGQRSGLELKSSALEWEGEGWGGGKWGLLNPGRTLHILKECGPQDPARTW